MLIYAMPLVLIVAIVLYRGRRRTAGTSRTLDFGCAGVAMACLGFALVPAFAAQERDDLPVLTSFSVLALCAGIVFMAWAAIEWNRQRSNPDI